MKAVRKSLATIQIINPIEYPGWDELILTIPGHAFFHSSAWAKVLTGTYNYKPLYFCLGLNEGSPACIPLMEIASGLTGKRAVSLPFTDYCEPLATDPTQMQELVSQVKAYGIEAAWKYVEVRGGQGFFAERAPSSQYFGHVLDLTPGVEKLLAALHGNTRRNIKRALKNDLHIEISRSQDALERYYQLHCITRKRHGSPPQSKRFFRKIHDHVIARQRGMVVLAAHQEKAIAAAVYLHFGKKAIYKFGASDLSYQHLRANDLVMWEAIKWFSEHGFETLCFGRTDQANEGLRRFKNGWSPKEHFINYYRLDVTGQTAATSGSSQPPWINEVFRRLPLLVLRAIGAAVYKHMG